MNETTHQTPVITRPDWKRTVFEAGTLRYRPMTRADQEQMFLWRTHPVVGRYLSGAPPETMTQQQAWFTAVDNDPARCFFIIEEHLEHGVVPLGYILFTRRGHRRKDAEFGVVVGAVQRRGLGRTLIMNVFQIGFLHMGFQQLYSCVQTQNAAAAKVVAWAGGRPITGPHDYSKPGECLCLHLPTDLDHVRRAPAAQNVPAMTILERCNP